MARCAYLVFGQVFTITVSLAVCMLVIITVDIFVVAVDILVIAVDGVLV
jgi:hypothetical protein